MGWIDRAASGLGKAIGAFQSGLSKATGRARAAFIGAWAESGQWNGGNYGRRGAQQRAMLNSWLYTAVEMIAREVSAARFGVVNKADVDAPSVDIPNHPLERLLRRPNPWIGRAFLWQYTVLWLMLDGNAYWYIAIDENGQPCELWPLPSQDVEVMPGDGERFIDHYEYTVNGVRYDIPSEYVVHLRLPNPFDIFRGLSPLRPAMLPVDSDSAMARWNGTFFGRDNVMPSAIINLSSGQPGLPVDPADLEALKADLRGQYQAANRKTAITAANAVSAVLLGWSPKDMDFIQGRQFTKEEIFAILGVPPGLLDRAATDANATTADRVFKEKTIWPLLVLIAEELTAELVWPFYGRDLEAGFADIRPANRVLELQEISAATPYLTIDEVRSRYWNLGPLPDGDGGRPATASFDAPSSSLGGILGGSRSDEYSPHLLESPARLSGLLPEQTGVDLKRWQAKAIKAIKAGRSPNVPFVSDEIAPEVAEHVREHLSRATGIDEIKAAFQEATAFSTAPGFFQGGSVGTVGTAPGRYLAAGVGD